MNKIQMGDTILENIEIDFGNIDPTGEIMGLIGMDLLKRIRAIIDIELPEISLKK